MLRVLKLLMAAIFAALVGTAAILPAAAAGMPVGAGRVIDDASKAGVAEVRHHRVYRSPGFRHRPVYHHRPVYRHRVYHHRPVVHRRYYRPVYYYPAAPVYRRCVVRPRWVWTPYGYVRRHVRVCR
jgi:hypothetical protein